MKHMLSKHAHGHAQSYPISDGLAYYCTDTFSNVVFFFFNYTAPPEIYPLSLPDALPIGGPPPLGAVFGELGPALGQAGLARFDCDVLAQAGVKYAILALGVNDMLFPGSFIPQTESVTARDLIAGNRQLIARAHKKGIRVIGTTIPPFEHAFFRDPFYDRFYSPENEKIRQEVNAWIRTRGEFDGVIDFDEAVRDRKSTRLNSSHSQISYAVFCLKKK